MILLQPNISVNNSISLEGFPHQTMSWTSSFSVRSYISLKIDNNRIIWQHINIYSYGKIGTLHPNFHNRSTSCFITHCLLVSSAHHLCKQFWYRSGPTKCRAWSVSKLFDTLMVFLKEFFKNVNVEKISRRQKIMKNFPACKELSPNHANHDWSSLQILQHFSKFSEKKRMIFYENCLPADDSHEISCLICYFWKSGKIWN